MRTLIIPDLHNHTENAEHWLKTQPHARVVFLGDFFDDFGDNVTDARMTAMWLRRRMDSNDDVFLLGNHDASYLFAGRDEFHCPGYTRAKAVGVLEILRPEHWKRFTFAHCEQGWLISHAGFHPAWAEPPTAANFLTRAEQAMENARSGRFDPIFGAGADRYGSQPIGGPLWMDWNTLVPIGGVNQIVGHTPGERPREKITRESSNHCLDVGNGLAAAVLEHGQATILHRAI